MVRVKCSAEREFTGKIAFAGVHKETISSVLFIRFLDLTACPLHLSSELNYRTNLTLRQSVNFFYLPSEITQTILHSERMIRLGGAVKKYSVHYGATGGVSFILTDFSKEFQIHYYGILPNLFREGQDIIAEGRFDKNGVFVATRVLAKHDERYMPREMVERLKLLILTP